MSDKKIYILLTNTGTWLTKAIKTYTKAPYNHVSIALDNQLDEIYSFGRKRPHAFLHGGFVKEDVVSGTFSIFPETTCALYELSVSDSEYLKLVELLDNFKNKEAYYSYHFIGLLGVALGYPIERDSHYFCSQFVSEILLESGIKLCEKHPALTSPDHFRFTDRLNLLYEGKLHDYDPVKVKKTNNSITVPNFSFREDLLNLLEIQLRLGIYGDPYYSFRKDFMTLHYLGFKSKTYTTFKRLIHL